MGEWGYGEYSKGLHYVFPTRPMRDPVVVGIWLLRICAALPAAVWLYRDGGTVQNLIEQTSTPLFFLMGGAALVLFGLSGRRSRAD